MKTDRLQKLVERRAQISARIAKLAAQGQAQERRNETRRKIVAGAILLEAVQQDRAAQKPTGIARWWDAKLATLKRPQDQRLFETTVESRSSAERSGATSPTGD